MPNFEYYNVNFSRAYKSKFLMIRGDITNKSGRDYNAVAIRIVLFNKNIPVINTVIVVNGVLNGQTKTFEKFIEEVEYDKIAQSITRYEVCTDSAY